VHDRRWGCHRRRHRQHRCWHPGGLWFTRSCLCAALRRCRDIGSAHQRRERSRLLCGDGRRWRCRRRPSWRRCRVHSHRWGCCGLLRRQASQSLRRWSRVHVCLRSAHHSRPHRETNLLSEPVGHWRCYTSFFSIGARRFRHLFNRLLHLRVCLCLPGAVHLCKSTFETLRFCLSRGEPLEQCKCLLCCCILLSQWQRHDFRAVAHGVYRHRSVDSRWRLCRLLQR
jgi:hypothetical protein